MIEQFWNILLLHDIKARDQLLREAVRVAKTRQLLLKENNKIRSITDHPERLFTWMKKHVDTRELGHFPGDKDLFYRLYIIGHELNLLEYTLQTLQNDRLTGVMQIQPFIFERFLESTIRQDRPMILIAESEKFLEGLEKLRGSKINQQVTLLTENFMISKILQTHFADTTHITVQQGSVYQPIPLETKFGAILCVPHFGLKIDEQEDYATREAAGIALENVVPLLNDRGSLTTVLPAKMMFQSGTVTDWRKRMIELASVESLHILPEGVFKPYSSMKAYEAIFTKEQIEQVQVGRFELRQESLHTESELNVPVDAFRKLEDWRIEWLLAEGSQSIKLFQNAAILKVKLNELADIFRGKSILKQDLRAGRIKVLNISNIEDGEVKLDALETIDEEIRKINRYEIYTGDLLITCRGTVTKLAIFPETQDIVIASANIIVLRCKNIVQSYYAKMFLESPLGMALIQSFQRGTTVMNLNPADLGEIEIPKLKAEDQKKLVDTYILEQEHYTETVKQAKTRWQEQRDRIYNQLMGGKS